MRKVIVAFALLLCVLAIPMAAYAAPVPTVDPSQKVVDYANLLTDEEEFELTQAILNSTAQCGMDMVLVTTEDDLGKRPYEYAEEFFENNGYGVGGEKDGVLLYINMDTRDVYFAACGHATAIYSGQIQNYILDNVTPYLSDGRYYEAFTAFIDDSRSYALSMTQEEIIQRYGAITEELDRIEAEKFNLTPLMAAGIAVPVAVLFVLILLGLHNKSMSKKPGIHTYLNQGGFKLIRVEDQFLHTHTSRVAKPQNNNNSGGGGGGIHRSSGGSTFSGSGRKF